MDTTDTTAILPPSTDAAPSLAVAGRLIDGIAAHHLEAVVDAMTPDVRFRALLPRRVLEATGRAEVLEAFETWFGTAEVWEMVEAVVGEVGGRLHLRWRVRVTKPGLEPGVHIVEQQVYADAGPDGRLRDVALICTGFLPEAS